MHKGTHSEGGDVLPRNFATLTAFCVSDVVDVSRECDVGQGVLIAQQRVTDSASRAGQSFKDVVTVVVAPPRTQTTRTTSHPPATHISKTHSHLRDKLSTMRS
jgi:hypothetical protein